MYRVHSTTIILKSLMQLKTQFFYEEHFYRIVMKFTVQSHSYLILINRLTPPHPPHPHLTCSSMRFSSCSAMLIFILTSSPSLLICVCCKTSTFSFNFLISLIRFFSKGEWYFLLFLLLLCLRIVDRFSASDCFGGAEIQLKVFFLNLNYYCRSRSGQNINKSFD